MIRAALLFIGLLIGSSAFAGLLEVDRVWVEGEFAYALVTYTNDTDLTFEVAVTIKCTAIGKNNKKINVNTRSFFEWEHGPIKPGFSDTLKVPVQLHGLTMKSMKCSAREQ